MSLREGSNVTLDKTSPVYKAFLDTLTLSSAGLPPLQDIPHAHFLTAVTHISKHGRPKVTFEDPSPDAFHQDYERFEFVGDSIVGIAVTLLITERYPTLTVGAMVTLKDSLVSNSVMANLARAYNLHSSLLCNPSQRLSLKANPDIRSCLFEALVCAVSLTIPLPATIAFLHEVFAPLLLVAHAELAAAWDARLALAFPAAAAGEAGSDAEAFCSYLNEWDMKNGALGLEYRRGLGVGPAHCMVWPGTIWRGGEQLGGVVEGANWKRVKQALAKQALEVLNVEWD